MESQRVPPKWNDEARHYVMSRSPWVFTADSQSFQIFGLAPEPLSESHIPDGIFAVVDSLSLLKMVMNYGPHRHSARAIRCSGTDPTVREVANRSPTRRLAV